MNGSWAILNNNMEVIAIFEGDILTHDFSQYQNYGGEVKYSAPFTHRGTPSVGWNWSNDLDRFVQ